MTVDPRQLAEFRTPAAFRAWLRKHHRTATALGVRIFKVSAAGRGLTYAPALDEALSYGWIDGVRHGIDADSFSIRFTPRKPGSIWSKVNVAHVGRLTRAGRKTPAGLAAFAGRNEHRTGVYSFELPAATLAPEFASRFRKHRAAWRWFEAEAPWYRRKVIHWVMRARREETREKRLKALIAASGRQARL